MYRIADCPTAEYSVVIVILEVTLEFLFVTMLT